MTVSALSLLSVWLSAILCHSALSQGNTFLEIGAHDGKILGIVSGYGTIAVVVKKKIFFYRDKGVEISSKEHLFGTVSLPTDIDGPLLEFKLTQVDTVLYCDSRACRLCAVASTCSEFKRDEKYSNRKIQLGKATREGDKLFIRFVDDKNTAWTSAYLLTNNAESFFPFQTNIDMPFLRQTSLTLSFSRGGFVYFVGGTQSRYEPNLFANIDNNKEDVGFVKISRFCSRDQTKPLESRIDLTLLCGNLPRSKGGVRNLASYYGHDGVQNVLYVVAKDEKDKPSPVHICRFRMADIEGRFEETWNICQNTTKEESNFCKRWDDSESPLSHSCHIFTRTDGYSQPCSRFEGPLHKGPPISNCDLSSYSSSSYRYGSLDDYIPLMGEVVALLKPGDVRSVVQILPDIKSPSLFLANEEKAVFRIPLSIPPIPSWKRNHTSEVNQRIVESGVGNVFYYATDNKVISQTISCSSLFSTCEDLLEGGYNDGVGCGWCPDGPTGGHVASRKDKFSCPVALLQGKCPPILQAVSYDSSQHRWVLFGKNLRSMTSPEIVVCGKECIVIPPDSTDNALYCRPPNAFSDGTDPRCDVTMIGDVADTRIKVHRPSTVDSASQTEGRNYQESNGTKSGGGGMSRATKGVIAAFSVAGIIGILVLIMWCAKKYYSRPVKDRSDGMSSTGILEGGGTYNRALNPYSNHADMSMDTYSPYEQISKEIDPKLKIDLDAITLDRQVGKGHFGIVFKGTYRPDGSSEREVACKMLQSGLSGVREFVAEGLIMARFNHPRVMRLIGIAFNADDFSPIIITEYMATGDLVRYLRDPEKTPTLRQLLHFAVQIAEGMEYLHNTKFIHRDLAARNCMLDDQLNIRIADFGLCRELVYENYEVLHKDRDLPLRWMPLEALDQEQQKFTPKGDVWAYGVVLWELMTRGMMPYSQLPSILLREYLEAGKRLNQPQYCPVQLFDNVMVPCWERNPDNRPTFTQLIELVKGIVDELESSNVQRSQLNCHYEQVNSLKTPSNSGNSAPTPTTIVSTDL